MLNYLKLEYQKFGKNSVVQLLVIMYLIFLPTLIFIAKEFPTLPPIFLTTDIFFEFPTVWNWMGYVGNWLVYFLLGFISVYLISAEVTNKTMRQGIINGMSRGEFFMSKMTAIIAISFMATLYYVICTFAIGWFSTKDPTFAIAIQTDYAVLRYFLMSLGYLSFGLLIGIVIRSAGIAVLLFWSYILFIEPIVRAVHRYYFNHVSVNYYPMNIIEDLHPMPFFNFGSYQPNNVQYEFLIPFGTAIPLSMALIIAFFALAYWNLMKKDM